MWWRIIREIVRWLLLIDAATFRWKSLWRIVLMKLVISRIGVMYCLSLYVLLLSVWGVLWKVMMCCERFGKVSECV